VLQRQRQVTGVVVDEAVAIVLPITSTMFFGSILPAAIAAASSQNPPDRKAA
jgi:hypothetical protein